MEDCESTGRRNPDRRFFTFPTNTELKRKWQEIVNVKESDIERRLFVCSLHFRDNCFTGKGLLKLNTIPSLLLHASTTETALLTSIQEETEFEINSIDNFCRSPSPHINPSEILFTYSRNNQTSKQADYTFEELDELSKLVPKAATSLEDSDEYCSEKCSKKRTSLFKKVRALLTLTAKLKARIKEFQSVRRAQHYRKTRFKQTKKVKSLPEQIDSLDGINRNCKELSKMLLSTTNQYSDHQKLICQSLYFKNAAAYRYARNVLKLTLPCTRSLYNWMPLKVVDPGFNQSILSRIKKFVEGMDERDKNVILIFDEMAIQECLEYEPTIDIMFGLVNYGEGNIGSELGKWDVYFIYIRKFNHDDLLTTMTKMCKICRQSSETVFCT